MKSKLTFLILLTAAITSCKKTTNVDVTLNTSGKLTYRLLDDSGKGLPNVKLSLYDRQDLYYSNTNVLLDARVTDANGQVDFGDLNPRNYQVISDSAKVNNITYVVQEYVQVTTGSVKNKETKVTDHSGTVTITIKSYNNNQSLKNIGVMIIPTNRYNYNNNTAANLKIADFTGVTNDLGVASFKIPAVKQYSVYLYNTVTNASYGTYYNGITVQKDGVFNTTSYIY